MASKPKLSLAWQMMIGLALGVVVGAFVDSAFAQTYLQPLGQLFIRLIRMVVVPLVIATIIAGCAGIADTSKLGRVAGKVLLVYAITTALSVLFGILFANWIRPGIGLDLSTDSLVAKAVTAPSLTTTLLEIVPINPMEAMSKGSMLQIIFFAVIFGFGLSALGERGKPVLTFFELVGDVMIRVTNMVIALRPDRRVRLDCLYGCPSRSLRAAAALLAGAHFLPRNVLPGLHRSGADGCTARPYASGEVPQGHLRAVAHCLHDLLVRSCSAGQLKGRPQARCVEVHRLFLDPARQHRQHERYCGIYGRLRSLCG